jgi:hypothetical protein
MLLTSRYYGTIISKDDYAFCCLKNWLPSLPSLLLPRFVNLAKLLPATQRGGILREVNGR